MRVLRFVLAVSFGLFLVIPLSACRLSDPPVIMRAADVVFPIHAIVAADADCTSQPIQATAVDARGRRIANRLVEWTSSDTTVLTVDSAGVVRVVACVEKPVHIIASVRRLEFSQPRAGPRPGVKL